MTGQAEGLTARARRVSRLTDALAERVPPEVLDDLEAAIEGGEGLAAARATRVVGDAWIGLAREGHHPRDLADAAGSFLVPWPRCREAFRCLLAEAGVPQDPV